MISKVIKFKRKLADIYRIYNARRIANDKIRKLSNNMPQIDKEYEKDIKKFWNRYKENVNLDWYKFYYNMHGIKDVRYIPDEIFYQKINCKYNKILFENAYDDKCYYDILFSDLKRPKTIFKNVNGIFFDEFFTQLTEEQAISRVMDYETFVVKPSIDSGEGRNVSLIKNTGNQETIDQLKKKMEMLGSDYIVQEAIKQHYKLASIHDASVNTLRIFSFLHKGEVHILSSVLRMGADGRNIDNQCAGGYTCGINPSGELKNVIYNSLGQPVKKHPQGFIPSGFIVPAYNEIIDIVKKSHLKLAHFGFVGWDFAVDTNCNPVFIEFNLGSPGIDLMQWCNGPLFGDMTQEILDEVYNIRSDGYEN
ncbi:MAG: sugar-transfer associated ATP-grasp domain-containing protein [Clostridia bacterium]|nr:sugar-transfer associated ATP-grasp domain-containing protein [Clostridia bacterium]